MQMGDTQMALPAHAAISMATQHPPSAPKIKEERKQRRTRLMLHEAALGAARCPKWHCPTKPGTWAGGHGGDKPSADLSCSP